MGKMTALARRFPWRLALAAVAGLLIFKGAVAGLPTVTAVGYKLAGKAPDCPWGRILSFQRDTSRQRDLYAAAKPALTVVDSDSRLDIQLIASPGRRYWIPRRGEKLGGQELLAYLLSDHIWMQERNPDKLVRKGDVVLDCGAHVGVFTQTALEMGASRVVAIEPDPVNLECLRRNFAAEIAGGRVTLAPKGVWSSEKTITLLPGVDNTGMNTMLATGPPRGGIEVPVTTIDKLVAELALSRVDYIKMDIEGAEREALAGARRTLARFRPRLMLDSYHRRDDMDVLPPLVKELNPSYVMTCGPCEPFADDRSLLVPHVTYYK